MDMSPAFISGFAFDKFHAIQALNKAQDGVRRTEQKKSPLLKVPYTSG
jgi:hypothetical protein